MNTVTPFTMVRHLRNAITSSRDARGLDLLERGLRLEARVRSSGLAARVWRRSTARERAKMASMFSSSSAEERFGGDSANLNFARRRRTTFGTAFQYAKR